MLSKKFIEEHPYIVDRIGNVLSRGNSYYTNPQYQTFTTLLNTLKEMDIAYVLFDNDFEYEQEIMSILSVIQNRNELTFAETI